MKLAISLIVLAALGQATSRLVSGKSYGSSPTIKRELFEGNFGDRTGVLHRYGATEAVPGIQYVDDFKHDLEDHSTPHSQIFGTRLPQVSKISDLLTGHGPSFEVALANHLYAPVSPYTKPTEPALFQVTFPNAGKTKRPSTKKPKKSKTSSTENSRKHSEFSSKHLHYDSEPYSYKPDFYPYKHLSFQIPSTLSDEEQSKLLKSKFSYDTPYAPQIFVQEKTYKYPLKYQTKEPTYQPQVQYYQSQHAHPSHEYGRPEHRQESEEHQKESRLYHYETTRTPEYEERPAIPKQAYHSHPNGAISYASYTSDQGHADEQPKYQLQYVQPQQQAYEHQPRHQQPIYVPEYVYPTQQQEAQTSSAPEPQQQYVQVPQPQYVQQPYVQQTSPSEKPVEPQYVPIPQPQYNELYLNPARHQLLRDLQQGPTPQPVQYQQPIDPYASTARPDPASAVQPTSPQTYQLVPHYPQYPEQPPQQEVVHILPQQRYTPTAYGQPAAPETPSATTSEPQYAQARPTHLPQGSTIEPDIINEHPRDSQAYPRSLNQKTGKGYAAEPTSQSVISSPSTPQPHTYIPPPAPTVQIQQVELQEIHSPLRPLHQQQPNSVEHKEHDHNNAGTTPRIEPSSSTSPSASVSSTSPDYEIEISSNVDHSQLPKDLRPVENTQEETQPQEGHAQHQTDSSTPQPQLELQAPAEHTQPQAEHPQAQVEQTQPQGEQTQPKVEQSQQEAYEQAPPQPQQNQPLGHQYQPQLPQTHVVPTPVSLAIPYDHHPLPIHPISFAPGRPILQPEIYPNGHEFVVEPHFPHSHPAPTLPPSHHAPTFPPSHPAPTFPPSHPAPTFPPVQFFGKFAETLFGGIRR